MNDNGDTNRLDELTNEVVEALYAICKRASGSEDPPFKALFAALDEVRTSGQIDQERENVLYGYVMRVGDAAKAAGREGQSVDLVDQLRSILEDFGITFVEPQEDGEEEETGGTGEASPQKQPPRSPRRRVSFDDARFEETWLSEHTPPINPPTRAAPPGLLSLPARRRNEIPSERRTRSTSPHQELPFRRSAPKSSQHDLPFTGDVSEADDRFDPSLYFEPSQTQLEQNAEAFLSTSALLSSRQALHAWHNHALRLQHMRSQAFSTAVAHDRRTLLKQAFDQWRAALSLHIQGKRKEHHLEKLCERAKYFRDRYLVSKAFTHWAMSCEEEQLRQKVAQRHVLRVTYFRRWRAIATENQAKIRRILVRKYLAVWREKTARRLLREEQAEAHYEEQLMKKCKSAWFWYFCSQRVEGWHEQWIVKKGFRRLTESWKFHQEQQRQAEQTYNYRLARRVLRTLHTQQQSRREEEVVVQQHRERAIASKSISIWHKQTKLAPIARNLADRLNRNLQHKSLSIWQRELTLSRQANEVNRSRLMQNAWSKWNDALRCKALAQKIDERVLMENLYRWMLQERLSLAQRTVNGRLLGRALGWWRAKVTEERDRLADAEVVFNERQRRRRLAFAMLKLNIASRAREDADRAAVEFANSRALPKALNVWKEQTDHARKLAKWAADSRFYFLCSGALKVWKERTSEHKANRRRDAYVQVRANGKIRLVSRCFTQLREKATIIRSMNDEGERRAQARVAEVGAKAFTHWQEQNARYALLDVQANELDQQKLLASALAAMTLKHAHLAGLDQEAVESQHRIDLSVLGGALRQLQWATFTASRKVENADALWLRNRDQHVRQMLRHWAAQTAARRAVAAQTGDETEVQEDEFESPSLRPASRAASRSAIADFTLPSSPPTQINLGATPSYLRTPSRPRRAGRFRLLPTPAPVTPMAFDSALLVTTPAPFPSQLAGLEEQPFEGLTPQVTPFSRKLRAGGFPPAPPTGPPASALRSSVFRRSIQAGTGKSVRFAGSGRFGRRTDSDGRSS